MQILACADNIDIINRSAQSVIGAFRPLKDAASTVGLVININKTKYKLTTPTRRPVLRRRQFIKSMRRWYSLLMSLHILDLVTSDNNT